MKYCGLLTALLAESPALILFIVTGSVVPGTTATLTPFTKKPNTSFKELLTNSGYSSRGEQKFDEDLIPVRDKTEFERHGVVCGKSETAVNAVSPGPARSVLCRKAVISGCILDSAAR